MASEIKKCSCKHDQQDKLHGTGMRVMNADQKGLNVTCTVCGTKHKLK